jgi:hypothetical protein
MTSKLFTYGVVILICLASLFAKLPRSQSTTDPGPAWEGAYRDGLYVGALSARNHMPLRAPVGRWSSARDRVLFDSGYRRGYAEVLTTGK